MPFTIPAVKPFYTPPVWFMIGSRQTVQWGNQMGIKSLAAIALALLIAGCSKVITTYVPDVHYDYSGEWTLKWLDSDSRHPVSLAQKQNDLTGIYTNAEDVACSISGTHARTLKASLKIDCPDWDIRLDGVISQKGTVISGRYQGEGNNGNFVLLKNKPVSVAGSKGKPGA
jgi:hypothetical protein